MKLPGDNRVIRVPHDHSFCRLARALMRIRGKNTVEFPREILAINDSHFVFGLPNLLSRERRKVANKAVAL